MTKGRSTSTVSCRLPDWLITEIKDDARREHLSVNEVITARIMGVSTGKRGNGKRGNEMSVARSWRKDAERQGIPFADYIQGRLMENARRVGNHLNNDSFRIRKLEAQTRAIEKENRFDLKEVDLTKKP